MEIVHNVWGNGISVTHAMDRESLDINTDTHTRHLVLRQGVITPTTHWDVHISAYRGVEKWDAPTWFYKANTKIQKFLAILQMQLRVKPCTCVYV